MRDKVKLTVELSQQDMDKLREIKKHMQETLGVNPSDGAIASGVLSQGILSTHRQIAVDKECEKRLRDESRIIKT